MHIVYMHGPGSAGRAGVWMCTSSHYVLCCRPPSAVGRGSCLLGGARTGLLDGPPCSCQVSLHLPRRAGSPSGLGAGCSAESFLGRWVGKVRTRTGEGDEVRGQRASSDGPVLRQRSAHRAGGPAEGGRESDQRSPSPQALAQGPGAFCEARRVCGWVLGALDSDLCSQPLKTRPRPTRPSSPEVTSQQEGMLGVVQCLPDLF